MRNRQLNELAGFIDKYSKDEGVNDTKIEGLHCFKVSDLNKRMPVVYRPAVYIIAQGRKQVLLENDLFRYAPGEFLAVSVDLPMLGQVTEASSTRPYLCVQIDLDLSQIAALATKLKNNARAASKTERGAFVGQADTELLSSLIRLMKLLDSPKDIPFLATTALYEVYYRLVAGKYAASIIQTSLTGGHMQAISNAIEHIKAQLLRPLLVTELAASANMSVSAFYSHFKKVTALSPLQYQKRLRLTQARQIMLSGRMNAARAAYAVGYESPSQFSREYARMFGEPPLRDATMHR